MALDPGQIAQVADSYLSKLSSDSDVRAGFAAASGAPAVAAHVASTTGMPVSAEDLDAIADHLNANRKTEVEELAMTYPALGEILDGSL